MGALKELAKTTPLLRTVLRRRYEKAFADNLSGQLYRGIFKSYAEAAASSPRETVGYNRLEPALMYRDFMDRIENYDYPVLFWLQKLLRESSAAARGIFDFGGHVGIKYYAYKPLLNGVPEWVVCDVPAVVKQGLELAQSLGASGLGFSREFADAAGRGILLCLGSLQYVEPSLVALLQDLPTGDRPPEVILNITPFTANDEPEYYTLNSIGTAFCPYKIQNERALLEGMERTGYELLNRWENPGRACRIPYQDEHAEFKYLGLRFTRHAPT